MLCNSVNHNLKIIPTSFDYVVGSTIVFIDHLHRLPEDDSLNHSSHRECGHMIEPMRSDHGH